METIKYSFLFLVLAILVAIVDTMSYKDTVNSEEFYCEQVNAGQWGNYREIDCKEKGNENSQLAVYTSDAVGILNRN